MAATCDKVVTKISLPCNLQCKGCHRDHRLGKKEALWVDVHPRCLRCCGHTKAFAKEIVLGTSHVFHLLTTLSLKVPMSAAVKEKKIQEKPPDLEGGDFRDWCALGVLVPKGSGCPTWFALSRSVIIISISSALGRREGERLVRNKAGAGGDRQDRRSGSG